MMPYGENRSQSPKVLSLKTLLTALVVHLAFFLLLWAYSVVNFKDKEVVIPIDVRVVVNENLDGKKDEPPPLDDTPPPPPPKSVLPKTPPKAEPPPKVDEKVDALVKVKEPKKNEVKKPDKKKDEKKPDKKKEPEKPKKTAAELRAERIARMRQAATTVKTSLRVKNHPSGDGRTGRKTLTNDEVMKLLKQGYVPGKSEQLATSESQRCASLIKMALDKRWQQLSPSVDTEGVVILSAQFTDAGRLINCRIVRSCGSKMSDRAALSVASTVGIVYGLSPEFIASSRKEPVKIVYRVQAR